MKQLYNMWSVVMEHEKNPLSYIPDMQTRHMMMQLLAWMWCIIFASSLGSMVVFGVTAIAHTLLVAGVFITVAVFEAAKKRAKVFGGLGRGPGGEHI